DTALLAAVSKFITEARAQLEEQLHPPPIPAPSEEPPPAGEGAQSAPSAGVAHEQPPLMLPPPIIKYVVAPSRPVYKQWWFWSVIGIAAAGGVAAITLGTTLNSNSQGLAPDVRSYYPTF